MQGNEGHAMKAAGSMLALVALVLAGCSGSSGLTTASLLGDDKPKGPVNDAPARAFQVGTVSARAVKCGFNFDPAKLKLNYLAYERQQPTTTDIAKIERMYDVSFNAVAKAVASQGEYCSDAKTKVIKADLGRHLAGDFTPSAAPPQQDDGSLFSGWGSASTEDKRMPTPFDPD
jgi:hypothetical protein